MFDRPPTLDEYRASVQAIISANEAHAGNLTRLERIASFVTKKIGSVGFFITILTWTILWLGWNLLAPKGLQFDPPMGFVLWLFISNCIQIMLMPMILIGQNIQSKHAEICAEQDLLIDQLAREELTVLAETLQYQNKLLEQIINDLAELKK